MLRKLLFWMLPFALGVLLFALDRPAACSAQQPDKPPAVTDDDDDWEVPPPGPRDENPPPKNQHRLRNPAEKNRLPEGMLPPPGRRPHGLPEGAPPGQWPDQMMPPPGGMPGGMLPGGLPHGRGGPGQGQGGPQAGPEGQPQGPGAMGPMMPGARGGYPRGYAPRGSYGYSGRMWGPFGGGMFFPSEHDADMLELTDKEHELELKVGTLSDEFHRAEGEKREKLKTELREAVAKQFGLRQERRRMELKRLEEGLKRMRDVIDRRDKAREQIINRHLSELLGEEDELRF
jgi:hypothetical protein